jgi:hypothetical protein
MLFNNNNNSRMKLKSWLSSAKHKSNLAKIIGIGTAAALTFHLYLQNKSVQPISYAKQQQNLDNNNNKDDLLGVILLTRHGARTPLYLISGLEEVFCVKV